MEIRERNRRLDIMWARNEWVRHWYAEMGPTSIAASSSYLSY